MSAGLIGPRPLPLVEPPPPKKHNKINDKPDSGWSPVTKPGVHFHGGFKSLDSLSVPLVVRERISR